MLNNLMPNIEELMTDSFANYLVQKLNKLALDIQIDNLLFKVSSSFHIHRSNLPSSK